VPLADTGDGMLQKNKWLRVLLWILSGLVLASVGLLLSVYFILKSPAMQQKIVRSLKEPLAKEGVELSVDSLSIDLLAGVHLQGLKVNIKRPPLISGQAKIEDLNLRYAIWPLFSKRLEIREAKLVGVDGDFALALEPSTEEQPKDPEALSKLLDLLRNPPISVDLPEFAMERVRLHLQLTQGLLAADLLLEDMNLKTSLVLAAGVSSIKLDAGLPIRAKFSQGQTLAAESILVLEPHIVWDSTIIDQDFKWNLDLNGTTLKMGETHVAQNQGQVLADIKDLFLKINLALNHDGKVPEKSASIHDIALPLGAKGDLNLDVLPLSFVDKKSAMQANLSAKARLDFEATVPRDFKKPEDVSWTLKNQLSLSSLQLFQQKQRTVSVPSLVLDLDGKGSEGRGDFEIEFNASRIDLKALSSALDLEGRFLANVDLPKKWIDLSGKVSVNDKDALTLKGKVEDVTNTLTAKLDLSLNTYPEWRKLHKGIGQLDQLAWPKVTLSNDLKLVHSEALEDIKDWSILPITNKLSMDVSQTAEREKAVVRFQKLLINLDASTQDKKAQGLLKLDVDGLAHKALQKSIALEQVLRFQADFKDLISAQITAKSRVDGKNRLDLTLDARETPKKMTIKDTILLQIDPSLKQYVAGLDILDDLGHVTLEGQDQLVLSYPENRIREVKSWDPARLNADVNSSQIISQQGHKVKYRLLEPLSIQTLAKLSRGALNLSTHVKAPSVEAEALATVSKLEAKLDVNMANVGTQDRVDIQLLSGIKGVKPLMESAAKVQDAIQNITLKLKAQVLQKDRFLIDEMTANVDGALLAFKGKGDMALSTGRGGFVGSLKSQLPAGRTIAGLKGTGGFEVPFTVTLYDKKVLAIQSEPRFEKLSFSYGDDIQVEGMDGKLSLAEELNIDEKGRIGFLYLNTQNPFTRVDFENIDPYLGQRISLKINKVRFKHIQAGPLLTNFELRQNLILLNEMKANLLAGSALGRVFIDLHPERLQLGFLGRFSNLQLELLKEPNRRQKRVDELSGRAAANFDIRKRLATGRVDVTSIGRNQLLSMIDVLDPDYKDTQMMTARRALQLSYPSLVSVSMEQGLMDLLIGLGGAVSTDISIRSVPLTAFINANAGEQLLTIEKFLQTGGQ
jgi:hypothetical protein